MFVLVVKKIISASEFNITSREEKNLNIFKQDNILVFAMVDFETLESEELEFGNNNFIEVARKKAISDSGENIFISVARGFITSDGDKRYKKNFTVPTDKEAVDFIVENLPKVFKEED